MGKYILIYPSVHVSNLLFTNNILYFKMFYQYINVNFIYIFNFCFFFFFSKCNQTGKSQQYLLEKHFSANIREMKPVNSKSSILALVVRFYVSF
jgi:hypothetical protein